MLNIIGWLLACLMAIAFVYNTAKAIESYKAMKEAKRKAMIWDARIK